MMKKKNGIYKRQTCIKVTPTNNEKWKEENEKIYLIVKDKKVVKAGGTRNGMKARFGSYLCGHHVEERGKSGKMSVTNAHIYHSIEKDLLETDSKYEFWTWSLPVVQINVEILGENVNVTAQTYHAYESVVIKKFKDLTGNIPLLCDNCDPNY